MEDIEFEGDSSESSDHGTCPHVTKVLIRRFLTDEVFRESHNKVAHEEQSTEKMKRCSLRGYQRPPDSVVICSLKMSSSINTRNDCERW